MASYKNTSRVFSWDLLTEKRWGHSPYPLNNVKYILFTEHFHLRTECFCTCTTPIPKQLDSTLNVIIYFLNVECSKETRWTGGRNMFKKKCKKKLCNAPKTPDGNRYHDWIWTAESLWFIMQVVSLTCSLCTLKIINLWISIYFDLWPLIPSRHHALKKQHDVIKDITTRAWEHFGKSLHLQKQLKTPSREEKVRYEDEFTFLFRLFFGNRKFTFFKSDPEFCRRGCTCLFCPWILQVTLNDPSFTFIYIIQLSIFLRAH